MFNSHSIARFQWISYIPTNLSELDFPRFPSIRTNASEPLLPMFPHGFPMSQHPPDLAACRGHVLQPLLRHPPVTSNAGAQGDEIGPEPIGLGAAGGLEVTC